MFIRSADGQVALPREYVVSETMYEMETEKVFSGNWLYVGRESEIDAEGIFRVDVRESQLVLMRGEDNALACVSQLLPASW